MNAVYEKLQQCYESMQEKTDFKPLVAIVLGSGLGNYADDIQIEASVDYHELPGFPVSTVEGHRGRFIFGYIEQVPVVIMQGRVHYYEGYDMTDVVLPIRLMKMMGAKALILTNAAGGVNDEFDAGDFMMITDQISTFVPSPLIGPNLEKLGERFCDMTGIYNDRFQDVFRKAARKLQIELKEGVYVQLSGPNFESPQEIKMCRILGADAVGMSTACEAVAAKHMGMKICGISCITNPAAGIMMKPLSHEEVQETADKAAPMFKALISAGVKGIAELL
ncbi:purine-nucleoside phosphorylase [Anaerostipes sp.]|uniref:purine-nucleoside phosphorylase n=1 Tax=Anaerostipes sp. TaxID=1872530 RepID=UPI0025B99633|nr:purine-nucleoside phosphorylase [Anaerostipes sp.]MBS7007335.1 purine-nucleoside phosphorylase [Anaerostipes sp.]